MKDTKKSKEQLIAELVESEEKYRIQVEMATDAVFLETVEGRILECNTAGAKMFGYTKEEIVGLTISDLVLKDFVKVLPKIITEKDTTYSKLVSRISKKKDGTIFPTEIATKLINIRKKPRLIAYIRDITECKRAEKKQKSLLKKEREQHLKAKTLAKVTLILTARLNEAQRIAQIGSWELDLITNTLYWSDEIYRMFDLKPQQFSPTYEAFLDTIHPDDRAFVDKAYTESVKNKMPYDIIHRLLLKDGTLKFVNERCKTFYDDAGKALRSIGTVQDITVRKQAEEILKDSEERLKILFDYAPDAYYISNLKGKFTDGNKAAERLMGYKKEELIGSGFLKLKLLSLADMPKAAKLLVKNLRGQPTGPDEFILNRKDNSKVTVEISTYPVKIKERTLVLGIARDITERKLAEEALVGSEEKYRTVFENTGTATIIVEEDKTISMANTQFEKLTGYSKDEIENKIKWTDFVIPEDLKMMEKYHSERRKAGEKPPTEYEFRLIDRKGKIKNIFLKVGKLPDSKKSIASLIDITENKKSEERLKETMDATIETMSKMIEAKDPYTSGHQHRVCQLAVPLAQELGLSKDRVEGIKIASLIHDIGKIGLPTEILSKPTKLDDIELRLIKRHSQIGYDILKSIDFTYPIDRIVLQHHERLNGSGYPNNMKGDKILLEAKIIGVADVVEAMSSHRPYRPALGIDKALEEITQKKGVFYDPEVADACLKLFKEKGFKFK